MFYKNFPEDALSFCLSIMEISIDILKLDENVFGSEYDASVLERFSRGKGFLSSKT